MRTSRFTDEQIIGIVREYEAGEKLTDLCRRHSQEASIHAGTAPGRVSRTSAEALPSLPMATKRDRLAESDFAAFVRFYRDLDRFGPADEPPSPLPPARLEALLREHGARHGVQVIEPALTHGAQAPDERASSSPAIACHSAR